MLRLRVGFELCRIGVNQLCFVLLDRVNDLGGETALFFSAEIRGYFLDTYYSTGEEV